MFNYNQKKRTKPISRLWASAAEIIKWKISPSNRKGHRDRPSWRKQMENVFFSSKLSNQILCIRNHKAKFIFILQLLLFPKALPEKLYLLTSDKGNKSPFEREREIEKFSASLKKLNSMHTNTHTHRSERSQWRPRWDTSTFNPLKQSLLKSALCEF